MIRKIIASILALVMFVATSGFTLSSHLCGGNKVDTVIGFSNTTASCGVDEAIHNCEKGFEVSSNCCDDQFQVVKLDENYIQEYQDLNLDKDYMQVVYFILTGMIPVDVFNSYSFVDYSPPLIVTDIPVLIQSFLI